MKTPTKPRTYQHPPAMVEAIKRVREVYPATHRFAVAHSVGNYNQYGEFMDRK